MAELHKLGLQTWLVLFMTIVAAVALASFLTYFVERPLCKYLRHVPGKFRKNHSTSSA